MSQTPTFLRFILESLNRRRRVHIAVALGVMTATAVLTGALVVGDSMRGSLRHLALDRLQGIDEALVVPRFFRTELVDEMAASQNTSPSDAKNASPKIGPSQITAAP